MNAIKNRKIKKYFVDAKITIGRAYKVEAKNEKEAIQFVKDNWEDNIIDQAHFEIEADAMEL